MSVNYMLLLRSTKMVTFYLETNLSLKQTNKVTRTHQSDSLSTLLTENNTFFDFQELHREVQQSNSEHPTLQILNGIYYHKGKAKVLQLKNYFCKNFVPHRQEDVQVLRRLLMISKPKFIGLVWKKMLKNSLSPPPLAKGRNKYLDLLQVFYNQYLH